MPRPRRNPHAPSPRGWRDWYQLAIWRNIRAAQLREEPLCRECLAHGEHVLATEVDHVREHRGDWNEFILGPKQSLCAACHGGKSARAHRKSQGFDERGEPLDPAHPWNRRR
jgi:5-methylcytosine-specific restriction enzyme A